MSANGASNVVVLTSSEQAVTQNALNFSLLKTNTILQGVAGAFITATVVISVVVGVAVFSSTVKYDYPEVRDDFATTYKVTPVKIYVLDNDRDVRQGNLTIKDFTKPRYGKVRVVDDTYFIYTPDKYYAGFDYFNYTAQNDKLASSASVTVQILNHAPDVIPQRYLINKNSKANKADIFSYKTEAGLKVSDLDDDILTVVGATAPAHGVVTFDEKFVYYTPVRDFNGLDSCNYTVSDGNDTATHVLTFEVFNSAPVANPDTFDVPKNTFQTLDVLKNDVDINEDALNVTSCGSTAKGKCAPTQDTKFVEYTPEHTGKSDSDSFEYSITDGSLSDSTFVIVNRVNRPPKAQNVDLTFAKNSKSSYPVDVASKYSDDDAAEKLTLSVASNPVAKGILTSTAVRVPSKFQTFANGQKIKVYNDKDPWFDYQVSYTPGDGAYQEEYDYTVTDSGGLSASAKIRITVGNLPPVTPDVTANVPKRKQGTFDVMSGVTDPNGDATFLSSVQTTAATKGTVTKVNGTHVTYVAPSDGSVKTDTFTYTACDGTGPDSGCTTGNVIVTIFNQAPVPFDDGPFTVPKGLSRTVLVLPNDVDPNNDEVFINSVDTPVNGGAAVKSQTTVNGKLVDAITFTALNALYEDSVTYDIKDEEGMVSATKATVRFQVINTAPVAVDDTATTMWNRSVEITNLLDNDSDENPGDKDLLVIASVTANPVNGATVTISGKNVIYTPRPGFVGTDTFTYTCKDQTLSSNTATVTVTVTNRAPVAGADTLTKHHLTQNVLIDVLANDSDPDGDAIVIVSTSIARAVIVQQNGKQFIQYSSVANSLATETFTYTISDYEKTATGTVTVTITDDAPVTASDSLTLHWTDTTQKSVDVVANDHDPNGDPLTLSSTLTLPQPFRGSASVTGSSITYTAPGNWAGQQTVTYTISDGPLSTTGSFIITITNLNRPVAPPVTINTHWRTQQLGTTIPLLSSATDSDGDTLVFTHTQPASGNYVTKPDALSVKYQRANFTGTDVFSYTVSDGLDSATGQITVTVFNNLPTAPTLSVYVGGNKFQSGVLIDLLAAATDADAADVTAGLTAIAASNPANGAIVLESAGVYRYTPSTAFVNGGGGADSFTYTVSDGLATVTGTVNIVVASVTPSATDKFFDLVWSTQTTGSNLDLNQTLVAVKIAPTHNVTAVTFPIAKNIFYKQTPNYLGTDYLEVTYDDGQTSNNVVKVNINVYNDLPSANAHTFSAHWKTLLDTGITRTLTTGATDPNGDVVTLFSATNGARGTVTRVNANDAQYKANVASLLEDSFTYTVTDGIQFVSKPVKIIPTNANKPSATPLTRSVHWRTLNGSSTTITVLASSTDADNDALTLTVTQPTTGGLASVAADGRSVEFRHDDFVGSETFQYTVSDGIESATSTITVQVTNTAPVAVDDSYTLHWRLANNVVLTPSPLANDNDANSDPLTIPFVAPTTALGGTASLQGTTDVRYTGPSKTGADSFSYTISDSKASATGTIRVTLTNGAPVANPVAVQTKWSGSTAVQGVCTDPNTDPLTYSASAASKGTLTMNAAGAGTYTPSRSVVLSPSNGRYETTDTISYTCSDSIDAGTNNVVVTIFNNRPVIVDDQYTFQRSKTFAAQLLPVTVNDIDADGDTITLNTFSADKGAQLTKQGNAISYIPNFATVGEEVISYTIYDGNLVSAVGYARVTMVNNAPVCNNVAKTINKGQSLKLYLLAEGQCTDANGDTLTLTVPTSNVNTKGTFTTGSDTSGPFIVYTPNARRSGNDQVQFQVSDGFTTVTQTLTVTIVNRAPNAIADKTLSFSKSAQSATFTLNPMTGTSDPDTGDSVSLLSVNPTGCSAAGSLVQNGNLITYTYTAGWAGSCTFQYTITDNDQDGPLTSAGNYIITATGTPPVAVDDRFEVNQGAVFSVHVSALLANDYDLNNDTITFDQLICRSPGETCLKTPTYSNGYVTVPADSTTCTTLKFEYQIKAYDGTAIGAFYVKYINCKCYNPADIVYIIDGSGSISDANWRNTKDFLKALTNKLDVGATKIRIGAVQFSESASYRYDSRVKYKYGFSFQYSSVTDINTMLGNLQQMNSWTGTIKGLDTAMTLAQSSSARAGVAKTFILLTDGAPNKPCSCTECQNYYGDQNKCTRAAFPGLTCSNCQWDPDNNKWCMPCADPRPRAAEINAMTSPFKAKIITVAVGGDLTPYSEAMVADCAFDASATFRVDWGQLDTIVSKIIDESCQG